MQAPCPECGAAVEFEPVYRLANQTWAPYCAKCKDKHDREHLQRCREVLHARTWANLCPPAFLNTVFEKLPCPDKSSEALSWKFTGGKGLNLWGLPNTGKTRSMFLILKPLHAAGNSIAVFSPTQFTKELENRAWRRSAWIHTLARKNFVCFDDMDKMALTAPMEKSFFGLLDERMQHGRPCIFTHNSSADEFEYRFKMGAAIVRRIREFTKSLHFP